MDKILIVDDELLILDGLERMIKKIPGLQLAGRFQNGAQAQKYLEAHPVDIVFTDVRMPVMDGMELVKWLTFFRPECHIVLISAYREFEYAQKAMQYGVRYFLTKPFRFQDVKNVVSQLVEERKRTERNLLWKQDVKGEIQEVEFYHALLQHSDAIETNLNKPVLYAEYKVYVQNKKADELMKVGLSNIFRWCAPLTTPILKEYRNGSAYYIVLSEEKERFPEPCEISDKILELMEETSEVYLLCCADIKELIVQSDARIEQDEVGDRLVIQAKEYIKNNLANNISRADVAHAVHLESSYFSKYFKKKVGLSFQDYLLKKRMEKVKQMLLQGAKVKDAMMETGYQNRNYFNQVFKEYTGCSPSEFILLKKETEETK